MSYAEKTSVSVERTQGEIKNTLKRYGAEKLATFEDGARAAIGFTMNGRAIRIRIELPNEAAFAKDGRGRGRPAGLRQKFQDADHRSRWRALLLVIKAKLEAVERGIAVFEDEFLAYTMLPNGKTVGEHVAPELARATIENKMPQLFLPGGAS